MGCRYSNPFVLKNICYNISPPAQSARGAGLTVRVLYAGEEYRLLYDNSTQFLQVSYEDSEGEGGGVIPVAGVAD